MKKLLAVMLLLGATQPAWAEPDVECDDLMTQTGMNECAGRQFEKADAELNQVYRDVTTQLANEPVALAKVKAAQRLWIQLRDADLEARYPVGEGENPYMLYGSMYPMLYTGAKTLLTETRTAYLRKEFLERREGDL